MVRWNSRLQPNVAEKTFRSLIFGAHRPFARLEVSNAQNH
jgi:hypothetical protein